MSHWGDCLPIFVPAPFSNSNFLYLINVYFRQVIKSSVLMKTKMSCFLSRRSSKQQMKLIFCWYQVGVYFETTLTTSYLIHWSSFCLPTPNTYAYLVSYLYKSRAQCFVSLIAQQNSKPRVFCINRILNRLCTIVLMRLLFTSYGQCSKL